MKNENKIYVIMLDEKENGKQLQFIINSVWSSKEKADEQLFRLWKHWASNDDDICISHIYYDEENDSLFVELGSKKDYMKFWIEEQEIDKGSGL